MTVNMSEDDALVAENRIGRFRIDDELVMKRATKLLAVFANVLVVRCEHRFELRALEYTGYSPLFEPCPAGSEAPGYLFIIGGGHPPRVEAGILGRVEAGILGGGVQIEENPS